MPGPSKPRLDENEKKAATERAEEEEKRQWEQTLAMQERLELEQRRREAAVWEQEQLINPAPNPLLLPREVPPQLKKMCPVCRKEIVTKNFVNHLQTSQSCRGKHGLSIENVKKKINAEKRRETYAKNKPAEQARSQQYYKENAASKKANSSELYYKNIDHRKGQMKDRSNSEYLKNPEPKKASVREIYQQNPELKRRRARERYEDNPEPKRAHEREAGKQRYQDDPEPKRGTERDKYREDPEPKRAAEREKYRDDPEPKRVAEREKYRDEIEHRTSEEALKAFRNRAINGPIFLCVCCAEFNFELNVLRVKYIKDVEESEFIDQPYRNKHSSHFTVLDSYWVCMTCLSDVKKGKLPKSSTLNIPADETPDVYKDMTDIENCLLAPVIVFVKLHNLKNQLRNTNKIVACPVSTDRVFENLRRLQTGMATLVRSAEYDRKVYSGQVRPVLVRNCLKYLVEGGYRHYGSLQQAENLAMAINRLDLASQDADLSGESFIEEEEVESDAVDDQRVRLDCVATAFLPDKPSDKFSPAAEGQVSNMTELRDPYSQMFPPRFPSGIDIHGVFKRAVTESEWLKHKLRGIDAWFSKNPLFIFTAAYRLDFQKISSTLHAFKGNITFSKTSCG